MKKSVLLFTAISGLSYLSLTSYSTGLATALPSIGNRTGSGGVTANCAGSGCHGSIDPNIYIYFTFRDKFSSTPVTNGEYEPGKTYEVNINPKYPNNTSALFGFQLTVVRVSNNADLGSTIVAPANTHITTVNNIKVLEHSTPLGGAGQASITFDWTAPPAGTGKIRFYAIANAVNFNGVADINDRAVALSWDYSEGPASVTALSERIRITAYPNPATDHFNLRFDDAEKGDYTINVIDPVGRSIYSGSLSLSNTSANTTISVTNWASGLYFAQIENDGAYRMMAISKQ